VADPTRNDDSEAIRQAGSTPEDGDLSTRPAGWPGIPPPDERLRSAGDDVAEVTRGQEALEEELPSDRAQERGGP